MSRALGREYVSGYVGKPLSKRVSTIAKAHGTDRTSVISEAIKWYVYCYDMKFAKELKESENHVSQGVKEVRR